MKQISLFEPNITRLEKKMVMEALNKNQISTYGYFTNLLVKEIKKITSSKYNLATNSGSSALFLAFKSIGVKKEEIIITQSYTFTATTNAIILNNSIPLLLDISLDDLNLDLVQLEEFLKNETFKKKNYTFHKNTKKKISCVCLVLTLGIIPNLDKINYLRKKYNLKIVFDAACALGHKYKKNKLTKYCDAAVYSLNGNKNFTAGAGGIISTDKFKYYDFAKKFANNGKIMNAYNYKMIGFNLNMSSLNAAVGLAQMKRFNEINKNKIKINKSYSENLSPIKLFNCKFIWGKYFPWMNFYVAKDKNEKKITINKLRKKNILVNNFWLPMHKQPTKKNFLLTKYPNTNYIYERIIVLPSSTFLSLGIIKKISQIIKKMKNI
jgi:perosamine synthetase